MKQKKNSWKRTTFIRDRNRFSEDFFTSFPFLNVQVLRQHVWKIKWMKKLKTIVFTV